MRRLLFSVCSLALVVVAAAAFYSTAAAGGLAQSSPVAAELVQLYEADQADRRFTTPPTAEDWQAISARDRARRERVMEILRDGLLETGDDYYHAAMVLQHADGSDDILTAHILATIAGFKGHERGRWLSAASLDRYLHRMDEPQRLGTQYLRSGPDEPWAQGAYDDWMPDSVRAEYGVPTRAEQQQRAESMNEQQP